MRKFYLKKKKSVLSTQTKEKSDMYKQSLKRPKNYKDLSPREQWEIDKKLGILDWDGS